MKERTISKEEREQSEYQAELPYALCDALLYELLIDNQPHIKVTRRTLTSGSCEYRLQNYGAITLRTTHNNQTFIRIAPATDMDAGVADVAMMALRTVLSVFWRNATAAGLNDAQLPAIATLPDVEMLAQVFGSLPQKKKPGAGENPINREAREALARGEDRKEVFRKWAQDKKYDLSDDETRKKADAAFRQMLKKLKQ